jgi:hypothetical protein
MRIDWEGVAIVFICIGTVLMLAVASLIASGQVDWGFTIFAIATALLSIAAWLSEKNKKRR